MQRTTDLTSQHKTLASEFKKLGQQHRAVSMNLIKTLKYDNARLQQQLTTTCHTVDELHIQMSAAAQEKAEAESERARLSNAKEQAERERSTMAQDYEVTNQKLKATEVERDVLIVELIASKSATEHLDKNLQQLKEANMARDSEKAVRTADFEESPALSTRKRPAVVPDSQFQESEQPLTFLEEDLSSVLSEAVPTSEVGRMEETTQRAPVRPNSASKRQTTDVGRPVRAVKNKRAIAMMPGDDEIEDPADEEEVSQYIESQLQAPKVLKVTKPKTTKRVSTKGIKSDRYNDRFAKELDAKK